MREDVQLSIFGDKMANMPSVAEVMKRRFCFGNKTLCARYQVVLAGLPVPADLFPNDTERLEDLKAGSS